MINPGGSGTVPAGLPQGETEQVSIIFIIRQIPYEKIKTHLHILYLIGFCIISYVLYCYFVNLKFWFHFTR